MDIINSIKGVFRREKSTTGTGVSSPLRRGEPAPWLYDNTRAEAISTVYCCVDLISKRIASMPVYYETLRRGVYVADNTTRINDCLNIQPDGAQSAYDFWRQVIWEVLTEGNAYIVPVINPADLKMDRLVLCSRGTVYHDTEADVYHVNDWRRSIRGVYHEDEIVHIKGASLPETPKVGQSVISFARQTIGTVGAANSEMRNRFVNGGAVRGFVTGKEGATMIFGDYDPAEGDKLADRVEERINTRRLGVSYLPGEFDFKSTGMTAADMQFLETLKYNVREICRFFGVHPSFVFDDIASNYKSAENATAALLDTTINPMLRNIESELHRKLIPRGMWHAARVRFDREAMYASNIEARLAYQTKALNIGARTVNEIRRADNKPPVPGGDVAMISANLKSLTEITHPDNDQAQ
jgi:HK97 family phage portal protein